VKQGNLFAPKGPTIEALEAIDLGPALPEPLGPACDGWFAKDFLVQRVDGVWKHWCQRCQLK
jgi:hypothetical protein